MHKDGSKPTRFLGPREKGKLTDGMGGVVCREKLSIILVWARSDESDGHFEELSRFVDRTEGYASSRHLWLRRPHIALSLARENGGSTVFTVEGADSRAGVISDDVRDTQRVV